MRPFMSPSIAIERDFVAFNFDQFLGEPLRDWDVSRPARYFGFEIPGFADNYWYVWFDAPIGYLGATREWADERFTPEEAPAQFDRWWRTDRGAADVTYTQFMGKDNVPFHTVIFPATLLGTGDKWTMMKNIRCDHRGVDGARYGRGITDMVDFFMSLDNEV